MSSQFNKPKNHRKTLIFLGIVMLINALSYGTIIPLLYPYVARFGLDAFGLSMLFVSFSLFQFLATPVIGRLSDVYGRRPLLLMNLFGTSVALALFASATSVVMLFVARILDGITGGNMSVAQAVIADTIEGKERAKAFGMLGASFGFGFLLGPAIGGYLNEYHLSAPFWFAAVLALAGTTFGYFFLEETLDPAHKSHHSSAPLFNFPSLIETFKRPVMGMLLTTVLVVSLAQNAFIIGFQSYTVDVLQLVPREIGLLFAASGLLNLFIQAVGIRFVLKIVPNHEHVILVAQLAAAVFISAVALHSGYYWFVGLVFTYMLFSSPIQTIVSGMISQRAHKAEQGTLLGVSTSCMSLGQIGGPLLAGLVAVQSVTGIFLLTGVLFLVGFGLSLRASLRADLHAQLPG